MFHSLETSLIREEAHPLYVLKRDLNTEAFSPSYHGARTKRGLELPNLTANDNLVLEQKARMTQNVIRVLHLSK